MKLLQKTAIYLLIVAIPVTIGSVFLLNGYIHREVIHEIDELLLNDLRQVEYQLRQHPPVTSTLPTWDPNVTITLTTKPSTQKILYKDSIAIDLLEKESIPIRLIRATYRIEKQHYTITIRQSYLEFDTVAKVLSVIVILCFLLVIGLILTADILIAGRIWQPFYAVINRLEKYRIDESDELIFPTSDVKEFNLLSQSLNDMTRRARQQYTQQKQFTDNASHEMQTPLSILSFELEQLQQSERLNEIELACILRSQQVVKRLSSLNKSLLLLAKIDNHQFSQQEPVDIGALVNQWLNQYLDYSAHKHISIKRFIYEGAVRSLNRQLAEILFSNLISNAIRHGDPGSSIVVQVSAASFSITNEGDPLPFPREHLFRRFVRNQSLVQSTGLGLALVKEIAQQYGMSVSYHYLTSLRQHLFEIKF